MLPIVIFYVGRSGFSNGSSSSNGFSMLPSMNCGFRTN